MTFADRIQKAIPAPKNARKSKISIQAKKLRMRRWQRKKPSAPFIETSTTSKPRQRQKKAGSAHIRIGSVSPSTRTLNTVLLDGKYKAQAYLDNSINSESYCDAANNEEAQIHEEEKISKKGDSKGEI